jgi:RimJ/RimL family protein N-acetyltransferase
VPAAMLATDIAFERLGLRELRSTCVSNNTKVRSLHLKSGFKEVGRVRKREPMGGNRSTLCSSC